MNEARRARRTLRTRRATRDERLETSLLSRRRVRRDEPTVAETSEARRTLGTRRARRDERYGDERDETGKPCDERSQWFAADTCSDRVV
ncbi:hypothetical protein E2C01_085858 [Portunus trituberculatus]|uniref:Uncharacterized protein n=1 Tax=Portunus trituberculatus TaxID=210409 RepID=A0A5B7J854_PORTR|nr:hypothetical protein [Portunus trituberculatus]